MKKPKVKSTFGLVKAIQFFLLLLCFEKSHSQITDRNDKFADPKLSISENIRVASIEKSDPAIELFQVSKEVNRLRSDNSNAVSKATYLDIDHDELRKIVEKKPFTLRLKLVDPDGAEMVVDLVKYEVFSDGFKAGSIVDQSYIEEDYQPGVYYRGVVLGESQSIAAISLFEDGVQGVISRGDGNWILGQLKNKEAYVFYNDRNLTAKFQLNCGTNDIGELNVKNENSQKSFCPLNVFWVGDFDFFGVSNYNLNNALNNLSAIFNNVAALYQQEGVVVFLSETFIHTTPDNYSETDSWNAFHSFGYQIHQASNFNEDLAMLLAVNINGNGSSFGIIDALCASFVPQQNGRYAYSRIDTYAYNVPTYSNTIQVVTHEMGHNLGSRHTHWCGWPGGPIDNCAAAEPDNFGNNCNPGPYPPDGGTIMSYCAIVYGSINFLNGFGYYPHQEIIGDITIASNNCLCLSVTENEDDGILSVFPNPASDIIRIESSYSFNEYRIVNSLGQIVAYGSFSTEIDISSLSEGVYSLVVINKEMTLTRQIVK